MFSQVFPRYFAVVPAVAQGCKTPGEKQLGWTPSVGWYSPGKYLVFPRSAGCAGISEFCHFSMRQKSKMTGEYQVKTRFPAAGTQNTCVSPARRRRKTTRERMETGISPICTWFLPGKYLGFTRDFPGFHQGFPVIFRVSPKSLEFLR